MLSNDADPFPYEPLAKRHPDNPVLAVSAFRRLYIYARLSGKYALAIFAVYKAVQKLEELRDEDDADIGVPASSVVVPKWVREGLWFALESYILKPQQPGVTDKKRVIEFRTALDDEWYTYRNWYAVSSEMTGVPTKTKDAAAFAVAKMRATLTVLERKAANLKKKGHSKDTLLRAYESVEMMFSVANSLPDTYDGEPLAKIESRDVMPTQTLLQIFTALRPI